MSRWSHRQGASLGAVAALADAGAPLWRAGPARAGVGRDGQSPELSGWENVRSLWQAGEAP
ncbi:hypothetical protein, partial [Tamilnaduibacter salinus]|uniref:hypothetical protein n=1 Tax=Tamilnaduibacter salinus TaxID=1484056 RepID=UPI001B8082B3